MHSVFINGLRREGRFEALDRVVEPADQPEAASAASVETPLALRDLERALDRLAPEQRAVLLLVALEGLAYDEAAAVLGVPIGTVMSRLSRARERLRRLLDPEEPVMPMRRVK
jgi:RNA polymerase sigma-70 factor (ECF subfamily)